MSESRASFIYGWPPHSRVAQPLPRPDVGKAHVYERERHCWRVFVDRAHTLVMQEIKAGKFLSRAFDEQSCPGHIASERDPKICGRCGTHIDSLRPDEGDSLMPWYDDSWKDGYDAWKLRGPDQDGQCFHGEYEIACEKPRWQMWATCNHCGHVWVASDADIEHFRHEQPIFDKWWRRQEFIDKWFGWLDHPRHSFFFLRLRAKSKLRSWWRGPDEEIPF